MKNLINMVELGPLLHFFGKMLDVRYMYMYIVNSPPPQATDNKTSHLPHKKTVIYPLDH